MNTLNIQSVLETSINKNSVNGGKKTMNNMDYLVVGGNGVLENVGNGVHKVITKTGEVVSTVASKVYSLGKRAVNGVIDTGKNLRDHIMKTESNSNTNQNGGEIQTGVSVKDIQYTNDYNTNMLIPSNFLNTNHVYFVRYHPEGTHLYNYKFSMNGGNVNTLTLSNVSPIWQTNNFNDTIPNNTLSNGQNILNNLINDLKTTHIGGYVNQRVADKDNYYAEYKNAKLKYLALKNQQSNNLSETSIDDGNVNINDPYYQQYREMKDKYLALKKNIN